MSLHYMINAHESTCDYFVCEQYFYPSFEYYYVPVYIDCYSVITLEEHKK